MNSFCSKSFCGAWWSMILRNLIEASSLEIRKKLRDRLMLKINKNRQTKESFKWKI
jgi:hypothetical protein